MDDLNSLYADIDPTIFQRVTIEHTYGEVLSQSIHKIIRQINIKATDKLYDLGAGLGKIILQLATECHFAKLCGIELNEKIHAYSTHVLKKHRRQNDYLTKNVSLLCDNFLTANFDDATIIFLFSPCFTQQTLTKLAQRINQIATVHTVVTLRAMPFLELPYRKSFRVEATWDSARCFVYQKNI